MDTLRSGISKLNLSRSPSSASSQSSNTSANQATDSSRGLVIRQPGSQSTSSSSSSLSVGIPAALLPHEDFNTTDAGYGCGTTKAEPFPPFLVDETLSNPFLRCTAGESTHCSRHCAHDVCTNIRSQADKPINNRQSCTCSCRSQLLTSTITEDPRFSGPLPQIVTVPDSLLAEAREVASNFGDNEEMTLIWGDSIKIFDGLKRTSKKKALTTTLSKASWTLFWRTLEKYFDATPKSAPERERSDTYLQIKTEILTVLKIALMELMYTYRSTREEIPDSQGRPGVKNAAYLPGKWRRMLKKKGVGSKIWTGWERKVGELMDLLVWRSVDVRRQRQRERDAEAESI